MKLDDYQALAIRTAKPLPTLIDDLAHAGIGFVTEIGEYASEVKRIVIYNKPPTPEMETHMAEEIGDLLWYIALGLQKMNISMSDAVRHRQHMVAYTFTDYENAARLMFGGMTLNQLVRNMARDAGKFLGVVEDLAAHGGSVGSMERGQLVTQAMWLMQWCAVAAIKLNVPLGNIAQDNIAKLRARFPDAYTDIAAEARADKAGVDHRNS